MWSGRKRRTNVGPDVVDLWRREVGDLKPRAFATLTKASEDLVLRLQIHRNLRNHRGCVNTVSFNADGNILVSGSDDRMIMLWDWDMGTQKLAFHSGHRNNVFQAKFMPFTNDQSIVTCAADGEVRHAQIGNDGRSEIRLLAKHEGRVHKIAIEPGSPHAFYSCGEDGRVLHFDLREDRGMPLFTCKNLRNFVIHLNAMALDPRNPNFVAIAGTDVLVRLYDVRKFVARQRGVSSRDHPVDTFCPPHLLGISGIGVTGVAFSDQRELLVSYVDEKIYLFTKNQGLGPPVLLSPMSSKKTCPSVEGEIDGKSEEDENSDHSGPDLKPQVFTGHYNSETMKGASFFGPNCEYVVSGSDCGRMFLWRKKDAVPLRAMEADKYVVNCIESHPHLPVLASSGIQSDIKTWVPNSPEPGTPITMDEIRNYTPKGSFHFVLNGMRDVPSDYEDDDFYDDDDDDEDDDDDDDDEDDDDDDDENDDNHNDHISDSSADSDDSDDGDLAFSDNCIDEYQNDHYLACGGGSVL